MYKRTAFTVPELLCVVALIAIIISLLLPSLQSAKETTRRTICANNLHQLQAGYYLYAVENSRQFPVTGAWGGVAGEGYFIATKTADLLQRQYLGGSYEAFYCPSALIRGFADYPSLKAAPTAKWWWETWQILANSYEHRVTGYGSTMHLNPAMSNTLRIRTTSADPKLAMIYDGNEQGYNGTLVPGWSWRLSHDDGRTGPEGANRVHIGGDVQWVPYAKMQGRWNNSGWVVWW